VHCFTEAGDCLSIHRDIQYTHTQDSRLTLSFIYRNAPFHPKGKHPAGGAENMTPEEYFVTPATKTKTTAFVGKGGLSDVNEMPVAR
jgi:hypothetical protein